MNFSNHQNKRRNRATVTQAEYIAASLINRDPKPKLKPKPITVRQFSWEVLPT